MILEQSETERFFKIWWPLLMFVNEQRGLVADLPRRPSDGALRTEHAVLLRNELWHDDTLREQLVRINPGSLTSTDLDIVSSWQTRVESRFFVLRYLTRHTIFIDNDAKVYGVLGLFNPIEHLLGPRPPHITDAVLLPFGRRIVIDGLLTRYPVNIGAGIRRMLDASYRSARQGGTVITSIVSRAKGSSDHYLKASVSRRPVV